MRGSWVSPFYLNCRQEIEPVANSNRPAFPASAPRRCARALPHLQVACTERCVPCHHAGQDTIFPACSSEAESGAWRPGRGGKDRFAQQTWMNLNAEVSVNGAVVHTWSLVRGQRGDHRGLKRADPRPERDTRVTAGRTGKEVEQEGGVAVRVTTTDERVAKAWKATKKRRYYPSSYVGLFRKSLDVYFSNTSKVICLLDYFIHNFFFSATGRVWLCTCCGCCSSCQRCCRNQRRELSLFYLRCSAASYTLQLLQCHWLKEGEVEDGRWTGGSREGDVHSVGVSALRFESKDCTGMETGTTDCFYTNWVCLSCSGLSFLLTKFSDSPRCALQPPTTAGEFVA